jgi:hypothetical protein
VAWIEQRGGRFIVRWRQKGQKDSRGFEDQFEAQAFLEHVERRLSVGDVPILPTGLGDYADRVIHMMEGIRESTRANYSRPLRGGR